ncbi:hypothetical protein [Alienimonas sp. DA493]|uniref:hypothetical protein n=1 Tax=Alienimonas sp. DA493 TaxID=3373605 RepID=UPI00375458B6
MDKLQPILTHRFWVVLGLTVCLALGAWWTGTGALAEQIAADEAKVKGLSVPNGQNAPNQEWIDKATEERLKWEAELIDAARTLAVTQEQLRTWPESYRAYVDGLGYFEPIGRRGREQYRLVYEQQIEELRQSLRPYDFETQTGVVNVPEGVLPQFNTAGWQSKPPLSMTVWSAQEDIWLMRELLEQVTKVNAGASLILDAPVKEIQSFTLRGGAGLTPAEEGAVDPMSSGSESGSGSPGREEYGEGYGEELMGSFDGRGEGGGGDALDADLDFSLDDDIGPSDGLDEDPSLIAPELAAAAEASSAAASPSSSPYGEMESRASEGGFSPVGGQASAKPEYVSPGGGRRYITSAPDVPYRTRAFKMQLVLDHRELNNVLADLSNSDWPVEIIRVHMVEGAKPLGPRAPGAGSRGGLREGGPGSFRRGLGGGLSGGGLTRGGLTRGGLSGSGLGGRSGGLSGLNRRPGFGNRGARPAVDPSDPYQVAMTDPYLATVVVGGIMTIYKPRTEAELAAGLGDPSADPAAALEAEAGADPAAMTEPGEPTDAEVNPLNPNAPADAEPASEDQFGVLPPADPADPAASEDAAMEEGADAAGFGGFDAGGDFNLNATPAPPGVEAPSGTVPGDEPPPSGEAPPAGDAAPAEPGADPDAEPVAAGGA